MAFKPNYNQARAERDRAKREKKAEKLRQQPETSEQRKVARDIPINTHPDEHGLE